MCDRSKSEPEIEEYPDYVVINGSRMDKPFVEKPIDANCHRVNIYFRSSNGGGHQELFDKKSKASSAYSPDSCIRRDDSYFYEEFIPNDGSDIKAYCCGPEFAYADARKCPALTTTFERLDDGEIFRCSEPRSFVKVNVLVKCQLETFTIFLEVYRGSQENIYSI